MGKSHIPGGTGRGPDIFRKPGLMEDQGDVVEQSVFRHWIFFQEEFRIQKSEFRTRKNKKNLMLLFWILTPGFLDFYFLTRCGKTICLRLLKKVQIQGARNSKE
jgi:hypothetical protein